MKSQKLNILEFLEVYKLHKDPNYDLLNEQLELNIPYSPS